MQPFLLEKRNEIAAICRRHYVSQMDVFGSAARDDFDPARSDVDLLVDFDAVPFERYADNKLDLEEDLVRLLHCDVDLIVSRYVRNPVFLSQLNSDRQLLYAA